jgi:Uma2 family endonuclease
MSDTIIPQPSSLSGAPSAPPASSPVHLPITIGGYLHIPEGVVDLPTFRDWVKSDEFPEKRRASFLGGILWVDPDMERIFSHNRVKTEYTGVLGPLVKSVRSGYFLTDGILLTNPPCGLSTEPDGMFIHFDTLSSGKTKLVEGKGGDYVEVEGTADMVLEVVSRFSVEKDLKELPLLYWQAGIREYWIVDARGPEPSFQILAHGPQVYVPVVPQQGWLLSSVFGKSFQLRKETDLLGHPAYTLAVRDQ